MKKSLLKYIFPVVLFTFFFSCIGKEDQDLMKKSEKLLEETEYHLNKFDKILKEDQHNNSEINYAANKVINDTIRFTENLFKNLNESDYINNDSASKYLTFAYHLLDFYDSILVRKDSIKLIAPIGRFWFDYEFLVDITSQNTLSVDTLRYQCSDRVYFYFLIESLVRGKKLALNETPFLFNVKSKSGYKDYSSSRKINGKWKERWNLNENVLAIDFMYQEYREKLNSIGLMNLRKNKQFPLSGSNFNWYIITENRGEIGAKYEEIW